MYNELIKDLRCCGENTTCAGCSRYGQAGTWCCDGITLEAADAIEDLIAALTASNTVIANGKPRWISVKDRLPEFDQKVLAWVRNKDTKNRFNSEGIYTAELRDKVPKPDPEGKYNFWGIPGYDSVWTVWSWSYFSEPDVLYWMPLPEPPKEET